MAKETGGIILLRNDVRDVVSAMALSSLSVIANSALLKSMKLVRT